MSDNQFGPPQPGFGPPQPQGAPIPPPQGAPQGGYGYPAPAQPQQPQQPWGGGAVPPQGYPAGAPAGYPMGYPAPPKRSRKGLWIGLSVLSVVILGAAGSVAYFVYDTAEKTGKYKVVLPQTFQEMSSESDPDATKQFTDELEQEAKSDPKAWKPDVTVGAIYRADDNSRIMVAVGGYGSVLLPSTQVDATFKNMQDDGDTISDRKSVDPGPLGGSMSCALSKSSDADLAVCVWADNSSLMMIVENAADGVTVDKVADDTRELRKASEVLK